MQGAMARAANAYYQTQVTSQTPLELVVMLYDGALRFMRMAADAMRQQDLHAKRHAMSRTMAIIQELQSSLNMEAGGEVSQQLDRLYSYVTTRLLEANMHSSVEPIDECIRLLTTLRDAWAQIATPGFPAK